MLSEELRKLKVWSCSKLCDSFRWLNPSESRDVVVRAVNLEPFRDNGLNFPDSSYFSTKGVDYTARQSTLCVRFISDDDLWNSIRSEHFIVTVIEVDYPEAT